MALANIAFVLGKQSEKSEKLLMIDWDLEAPGLHEFFTKYSRRSTKSGVIDLFYEIRDKLRVSHIKDEIPVSFFSRIALGKYIQQVRKDPPLYLMRAGNYEDPNYYEKVNRFDWKELFDKYPRLIPQFANFLRRRFKYVLIDSRTGYTDISGICTSLMPEKLVILFTPNKQNIFGTVKMIYKSTEYRKQSEDLRPLVIYPLVSRIESAELKLQDAWRFGDPRKKLKGYQAQIEKAFKEVYGLQKCNLSTYFDEVQLQHIPRFAYGEEIAILIERASNRLTLSRSYQSFAARLLSDEPPWKARISDEIARDKLRKIDAFISFSSKDAEMAIELRRLLVKSGVKTFFSPYDLRAGSDFEIETGWAINNSKCLIYLATPNSIKSRWTVGEIYIAESRNIPILLVVYKVSLSDLPEFLLTRRVVEFHDKDKILEWVKRFSRPT